MIHPRLDSRSNHAAEYDGTWSPFSTSDSATSVCDSSDLNRSTSGDMTVLASKERAV